MKLEEQLLSIFKRVLRINFNNKDSINVENIEEWDSLSHIKLIMELERELMVSIEPEKIPYLYSDYNTIFGYLKNKLEN